MGPTRHVMSGVNPQGVAVQWECYLTDNGFLIVKLLPNHKLLQIAAGHPNKRDRTNTAIVPSDDPRATSPPHAGLTKARLRSGLRETLM